MGYGISNIKYSSILLIQNAVAKVGLIGPETIGKLQQYLGATYGKVLSRLSRIVKELQRLINNGISREYTIPM
ncbi:hypothetical protein GI584_21570 [Gracilibacillus salitolerans]|uniref:Uncharacterized protein n=1 Tax=Gracilibacillus salitolerans TaxID=2663022 RepID=A0A5Q2TUL7_9BACI|nr:hypothetical protein [Gracilibacillus salitolerans]QGH36478.1 hypothetical protein GI584_21570 [Gracilibacillus salitolerans]